MLCALYEVDKKKTSIVDELLKTMRRYNIGEFCGI